MIFLIFCGSLRRDARGVFRDIPPPAAQGAPDARAPRRALRCPQRGRPLLPPVSLRREQLRRAGRARCARPLRRVGASGCVVRVFMFRGAFRPAGRAKIAFESCFLL